MPSVDARCSGRTLITSHSATVNRSNPPIAGAATAIARDRESARRNGGPCSRAMTDWMRARVMRNSMIATAPRLDAELRLEEVEQISTNVY
jgi:hypothetical protein